MRQLTEAEAIRFYSSEAWRRMSSTQIAHFQMQQDRLCVPLSVFHEALEETLGRSVWTHELGLNRDGLAAELAGRCQAPSMEEILALLPADRTIVVAVEPDT